MKYKKLPLFLWNTIKPEYDYWIKFNREES